MASTTKLCEMTHYREMVHRTSDEEILEGIEDTGWCYFDWPIHRHYLRLLKQEAYKRGLMKGGGGASLRT